MRGDAVIYADALAATKGPWPISRMTSEGYHMLGYLDGSVEVVKNGRVVKTLSPGTGTALGYTDWEAGQGQGMGQAIKSRLRGAQTRTGGIS